MADSPSRVPIDGGKTAGQPGPATNGYPRATLGYSLAHIDQLLK